MLLTPHTAAGVAIASLLPEPWLAIPLSFLSHFVLDFIPHWDRIGLGLLEENFQRISSRVFRLVLLDALFSLVFVLFFIYRALGAGEGPDLGLGVLILFSALAANLPDLFYIPLAFFGKKWGWVIGVVKVQSKLQERSKASFPLGMATQIAVIGAGLLIALQ